jgi:hypothetical protein
MWREGEGKRRCPSTPAREAFGTTRPYAVAHCLKMIFLQNRGPLCAITLQAILRWVFPCGRKKAPAGGPRRQVNAACDRARAYGTGRIVRITESA